MLNKPLRLAILSRDAKTLDRFLCDFAHDITIGSSDLYRCELDRYVKRLMIYSVNKENVIFDIIEVRGFTQFDDYFKVFGYMPDAYYVHDITIDSYDRDVENYFHRLELARKTLCIRDDYADMVGQIRRIAESIANGVNKEKED